MAASGEIDDIFAEAERSAREERQQHAAFLYERARRLALECGEPARAFSLGVSAARCWGISGEYERALGTILELLTEIPPGVDPIDVYDARMEQFWHSIDAATGDLASIRAMLMAMDDLYSRLEPGGPNTAYFEGKLLRLQGQYGAAYEQYEIAWSRWQPGCLSMARYVFAHHCAKMAIRLDRMNEAERWISRIQSDYWERDARIRRLYQRTLVGLRARDPLATRSAITDLDETISGVQRPRYIAQVIDLTVSALCLDPEHGDPQQPTHPASHRLADFPRRELQVLDGRQSWTRAVLAHRLASLRYAAGMPPDENYFGRPPQAISEYSEASLPDELPARTMAARVACDEAMVVARQLDEFFESDWRQVEVANLRRRIEDIAAATASD